MADEKFPIELETLLATLARLFAARGEVLEVAVLANSAPELVVGEYDNWNGGTYSWHLLLSIDLPTYSQLDDQRREAFIQRIQAEAGHLLEPYPNDFISKVFIRPSQKPDPQWREKARGWISGKGITNQGRVRSDNIATRECDGLLFRSEPEILLYRALKSLSVSFAPLPVFIRGGEEYRRIEPDFVLVRNGIILVVEVDGDTVHHETPAEAHLRTKMLIDEGVRLDRIKASDCDTPERAASSAKRIIALMEKFGSQR